MEQSQSRNLASDLQQLPAHAFDLQVAQNVDQLGAINYRGDRQEQFTEDGGINNPDTAYNGSNQWLDGMP